MPYPNEHAARLRDPADFDSDSFRRVPDGTLYGRIPVPETIDVIWAKLKGKAAPDDPPLAQALHFPTKDWTEAEARKWLADNKIKVVDFEPASSKKEEASGQVDFVTAPAAMEIIASAAKEGEHPRLPRFKFHAYTGGPMRLSGWSTPVVVDLQGVSPVADQLPVRLNHDPDRTVGHVESVHIEPGEIVAEGVLSFAGEREADRIARAARQGFKWQASIGARAEEAKEISENETVEVNGRTFNGPLTVITKATLGEISFVDLGADSKTSVSLAASARLEETTMAKEPEKKVDAATTPDVAGATADKDKAKLEAAGNDLKAKEREDVIRAEAAKGERDRLAKVEAACRGMEGEQVDSLKAKATSGEIGFEALQAGLLDVLRASRSKVPAIHDTTVRFDRPVIEAAALRTCGVSSDRLVKHCGEQAAEAAQRVSRMGIQQLVSRAAALDGVQLQEYSDDPRAWLKAAFSTLSVPGILSNVANKLLLDGYSYVEDAWRRVAKITTLKDFKLHTRYRLTDDMKFEKVGPTGELKHGALGEQSFTQQADTHGIMFSLPRQLIINDDLGAFAEIPTTLGRGAAEAITEAVWTLLLSNPSNFFYASHTGGQANYAEGSDTALGLNSLTAAELLFLNQTKPNGRPLGIPPKFLLVPPALSVVASLLYKSLEIRDTNASTKYPVANAHAGKYEPVVSTYLSNATISGYSPLAWYLFADPNVLAAIDVGFLNGVDRPTVQSTDEDFNILGIRFRGFIDFGVAMQDFRAAVKMKGEA